MVVSDGDSRSANTYESKLGNWITKFSIMSYVTAHGGWTTGQMLLNGPTNVDPLLTLPTARDRICIVWGGVNDSTTDPNATWANLQSYGQARRAAGWKMILCTEIDARGSRDAYGWHDTVYPGINTLIRNNWRTCADGVADLGSDIRLQDATDLTYFTADQIHPNSVGYGIVASIIANAIDSLP